MDYRGLVKRLQVPDGYIVPRELSYHDIRAHDLYPLGGRTPLTADLLRYDVDVSWWVTPAAYQQGYYQELYQALQHWISSAFPFQAAYYSNTEIQPQTRT